ncbi:MAG: hypothetical protein PVJ34_19985 [Anaerolineae bacterium]|jgi:hypothetical protein
MDGNTMDVPVPAAPVDVQVGAGAAMEEAARQLHEEMASQTGSWGRWLLLFGVINLVASSFLSAPYGILLLVVGLASFVFREMSMFVIYGVTLGWAALSNALSAEAGWIIFALFQVYLAFNIFRRFFHYRREMETYADTEVMSSPSRQRAARIFPWAGFILGGAALSGVVLLVIGMFALAIVSVGEDLPGYFVFVAGLVVDVAILGTAVCLASLLSRYKNKIPAILGLVGSLLVLVLWLVLALF